MRRVRGRGRRNQGGGKGAPSARAHAFEQRNDTTSPSSRKSQYRHCFSGDDEKKLWCRYSFFFPPSWTDLTVIYQLPSTMILILYYHFGRVPRSCCSYLDILVSANVQRLQTHSAPDARDVIVGKVSDRFITSWCCCSIMFNVLRERKYCPAHTVDTGHDSLTLSCRYQHLRLLVWRVHAKRKFHPFSTRHYVDGGPGDFC